MKAWSVVALVLLAGGLSAQRDPRADVFVQRGCTACHAISALGVKASSDVGPDLTFAYADVVNRYGANLESFLSNPSGVMRLLLASHLRLSVADRDSMVRILKRLYVERRADMHDGIPSLPPGKPQPRAPRVSFDQFRQAHHGDP